MSTFAAFEAQPDIGRSRRLLSSTGAALLLYALGALAIFLWLRGRPEAPPPEQQIDVLFEPPAPEPEAAPPPPPPPPRPIAKAPVVEAPAPAPAEPVPAPKPTAGPTGGASGIDVGRTGGGDPTGAEPADEPEAAAPVTPPPVKAGPVNLPEDAEPPEPDDGNEQPEYPTDARAASAQAVVILKIVIDERGNVTRVDVLKGDEPFVSAATSAVRRWHYTPAQLEGKAIAVFKIVKVTFKP